MDTKSPSCRRTRRFHTRSRAGCLTCRGRRKRCSEEKPTCIGCRRNFLICTWPKAAVEYDSSPVQPAKEQHGTDCPSPQTRSSSCPGGSPASSGFLELEFDQSSDFTDVGSSPVSDHSGSSSTLEWSIALHRTPSSFPRTLATPGAKRLYQHFYEETAGMLAARPSPQNPYSICLLPLAVAHDYVMHAVLATSGSHWASSKVDESVYPLAREHYAVALRAAKHQITRFSLGTNEDPLALVALLLMLCQFECVEGNLQGAVLHHLEAAGQILASLPADLIRCSKSPYRFLIELFVYHSFVSRNVTMTVESQPSNSALSQLVEIVDCSREHLDGYMFGYAYELYKLIPQIRRLYMAQYTDESPSLAQFEILRVKLQRWRPPEDAESGWNSTLKIAALIYQQALQVYLLCAQHGPGEATMKLFQSIEPYLDQGVELMKLLPSTCTEWTTLSWPLLLIGSCLRDRQRQEYLVRTGASIVQRMYAIPNILKVMRWVWNDEVAYGPYGLERVMAERNVKISVG